MSLTKQEIFTKAYAGLKSQGFERSTGGRRGACMYRGENGMKCAVGWPIPDDKYDPTIEGTSACDMVVINGLEDHFDIWTDSSNYDFIINLQECHDKGKTPAMMERNLRHFAKLHELKIED
jgi:hypothetical protein